ncbi:HIT family protein [Inhella gelatinilytica]|uniref:HIT family protein n=1 Tax=Inhella gelatinilytica TaxID=2795030 RepID=A0A931J0T0_9BURK|nr:HIT family protein [Inhella gelatinilytica]MBH9553276.1 HIT family protein [Inhella gelatinilytica]
MNPHCVLCREEGGVLVHQDALLRIVRVTDTPAHPAFYRVILNRHVAEFSQLPPDERRRVMEAVVAVEQALLAHLQPIKINLASLGNVVPHLHWHVIARAEDDAQFPAPIWANPVRERAESALQRWHAALPGIDRAVLAALAPAG